MFSLFKNSEPYKYSLELIENNQDAMEYLGEEYKLPIIISGSMSMNGNGTGQASLSYKKKGKMVFQECISMLKRKMEFGNITK
nr:cytochrome c oxidase assembly factor Coa1 family protein [Treponema sp. OMZ 855]